MMRIAQLRLTPRDLGLLQDLAAKGLMSFSQVKRSHFGEVARVTMQNRISKLVRAGFIASTPVGISIHSVPELSRVGQVYWLTAKGVRTLSDHGSANVGEVFVPRPPVFATLAHDLILSEVIERITKSWNGISSVSRCHATQGQIPDAVVEMENPKRRLALELELTAKSERRYLEILSRYRLDQKYSGVLYVTKDQSIRDKIIKTLTGIDPRKIPGAIDTRPFSFMGLEEVLGARGPGPPGSASDPISRSPIHQLNQQFEMR